MGMNGRKYLEEKLTRDVSVQRYTRGDFEAEKNWRMVEQVRHFVSETSVLAFVVVTVALAYVTHLTLEKVKSGGK